MLASPTERKKNALRRGSQNTFNSANESAAGGVFVQSAAAVSDVCFSADGMESVRLSEIYGKLEEIEADKAPAR